MTGNVSRLAGQYLGRPLLLTPQAAEYWAGRIRTLDPDFASRSFGIGSLVRKLAGSFSSQQRMAMEDHEDGAPRVAPHVKAAYRPLYAGEPDDVGYCWALKDGVAMLQVDTPLLDRGEEFCGTVWHGYDTLLQALREAHADQRVKAIFIRAASPGGIVAPGLGVLATWMRDNRAAAGGKPIWVYCDMSCSAMYWITASADWVIAGDVSTVGSIGAVIVHEDYSGAMEKFGVKVTAIQFGLKKTDGAYWEALSPRALADLQAEIDQCGRNFVAAVTAGRPILTADKVLATEAACYLGLHDEPERSALALGLVDQIMGEEQAFNALVQKVSGSAPESTNATRPAADGQRTQEHNMATKAQKAARVAALKAEITDLQKDPAKNAGAITIKQAELKTAEEEPADDEVPEDPSKSKPDDEKVEPEAVKIAKSPQAKAHPALANAAIASQQTYSQFLANVEAAGTPKAGKLADAMRGSGPIGPDALATATPASKLDPKAIYDRRRAAARKS